MSNVSKVFIYGVPGAGKTTLSNRLQSRLGYPLIEADALRQAAQKEKTKQEDPFVYLGTTEAFHEFGELSKENVVRGLKAVRAAMAPHAAKKISAYPGGLILEGAFLDPEAVHERGKLILIVTSDEQRHQLQFFEHRERNSSTVESFQAARIIQEYLLQEAKQYAVTVVENNASVDELVEWIK